MANSRKPPCMVIGPFRKFFREIYQLPRRLAAVRHQVAIIHHLLGLADWHPLLSPNKGYISTGKFKSLEPLQIVNWEDPSWWQARKVNAKERPGLIPSQVCPNVDRFTELNRIDLIHKSIARQPFVIAGPRGAPAVLRARQRARHHAGFVLRHWGELPSY